MSSRRALQIAVALAAVVPIVAGAAGALVGARIAGDWPGASLDSHVRYLSGLLLGIGLAYWAMVPRIERRRTLFAALSAIVVLGGLARLLGLLLVAERPGPIMQAALLMELVVTPLLALWQGRVAAGRA